MTSRRAAMRAYGEYLDFAEWLAKAREGLDVDPEDPPRHELAQMVKSAQQRFEDKAEAYIKSSVSYARGDTDKEAD